MKLPSLCIKCPSIDDFVQFEAGVCLCHFLYLKKLTFEGERFLRTKILNDISGLSLQKEFSKEDPEKVLSFLLVSWILVKNHICEISQKGLYFFLKHNMTSSGDDNFYTRTGFYTWAGNSNDSFNVRELHLHFSIDRNTFWKSWKAQKCNEFVKILIQTLIAA